MLRSGYKTLLVLLFVLAGSVPLAAYYYFPNNQPPGPPPNYNQIDPEYFYGVPPMDEMIQRDGYFVYFDSSESLWTINSVIPSGTPAFEQFHGAILVQLEEEPAPGVNVFPLGFDLTQDLHRNDRWGWVKWPDSIAPDLYEIWWDITIDCPGALIGCSRTIGFWKTHAGFGPQDDLVTPLLPVWLGTPGGKKSFFVDSAELAEDILSEDVYGDASNGITKLYAQLLGAKLNILSGASAIDVIGVISVADAFLAEHDWRDWDDLSAREQMTILDWKDTLDDYNNGYIGPGHCDDFPEDTVLIGDSTCFIGISFKGCAFDFNLWGSGYNRTFDADHVFLGRYMEPLGYIIDFEDTFEGIYDPYGHPFDCDSTDDDRKKRRVPDNDCLEPNLSVFTRVSMPGASYNYDGMIESGNEYGNTYGGSRVYNGNGIQFGVYDCEENNPPTFEPPVGFLKPVTLCLGSTVYDTIIANDFDPNDTVTVIQVSGPGNFSSTPDVPPVYGYFTWTPAAEGQYAVVFQASDQHGATVIDSVVYTITFDKPPTAYADDTTIFICWNTDEVCYTVTADDAEGDPLTFMLLSGSGSLDAATGELCFTPGGEGQYPFTVEVADSCGADTVDFTISILANRDPAIIPYDSMIVDCDLDTVCFPVGAFDPDAGDILEITLLDGPGSFTQTGNTGGTHCFYPDSPQGGRYVFHFQVTDECWREAIANGTEPSDPPRDSVTIVIEINQPPVITCPGDHFEFLCDPDTLCFDISAFDPDGDELLYEIVSGQGSIDPVTGQYCLYADAEGTYPIIVSATDTCGNFDTCSFDIEIDLNQPPTADITDTTVDLCGPGEVCIPYTVFDPDDNIVDILATNEQGEVVTVQNGYLCFTPDGPGVYPITITVTDDCDEIGMDQAVVTVTLIEDVSIDCPPEPFMISLCGPDTICVDAPVSPPDAALTILEPGATYADGKLCTYVEETGVYIFTLVAAGECNTDTCRVIINASMDEEPQVTCPVPDPVHLCGPDSISVPLAVSPASAIVSITPWAVYADGQLTFYADSPGEYAFTVVVENACGADTCSFSMAVTIDSPPQVTIADSAFHLCELQEVCIPYEYSDPDDNVVNVRISPLKTVFKLVGGNVCFTPPDAGTYELVLTVTDSCGLSASDTSTVVVTLNEPPSVIVGDTTVFTCDSADICLPVTAIDPDGTISSIEVESPAYYDEVNGVVCLPVTGSGTYRIGVVAYDDCGAAAVDTGVAIVTFNSPPEATAPVDTVVSVCNIQEICLSGFEVFDLDDNVVSIEFNPDIGVYEAGTYCFLPDTAGTYCLTITVTDACGEKAEDTVCVLYEIGTDVFIDCPDAIKIQNLCGPDSVCLELPPVSPPDAMVTVLEPGAIIANGRLCFYAEASGTYTYTMVATGECGSDTCVLEIPVAIYEPPQVTCPPSDSVHLCGPDSISVPLAFTPESAQFSVTPPGTYENGQFTFYAAEPGEYCFTAIAENECGSDTCTFCITVTFDSPPEVTLEAGSIYLCELEQICIPVNISDPDDNIAEIVVLPEGAVLKGDSICFTPTGEGIHEIGITVTDSCGNFVSGSAAIAVTLNRTPFVDVADTSLFLCDPGLVCLPVVFGDPDGVIDSIVVAAPAYYDADNQLVCLEVTEPGTYKVSVTVYDDCETSANDTGTIAVTFNSAPTAILPADTSIFLCEPAEICVPVEYDDVDGNIDIVEIIRPVNELINDTVCFFADESGQYEIILRVTDSCGVADEDTMKITVSLNQPPTVTVGDSSLFACEPTTVCLPVEAFDPEGAIDSIIVDAPAYYDDVNEQVCLPVEESGSFDVIVTVYDDCGIPAADTGTVAVTFNSPPMVTAPADTSVFFCAPTEVCLDGFIVTDPDDNITSVVFEPNPGTYADGRYCFTPASAGQYCFVVRATDECGVTAEDTVCVLVELGDDVFLTCPDTQYVSLCEPDSVCADISYSPPTANIRIVEPGATFDGSRVCFYAESPGIYAFTIIATGQCGEDTCQVVFDITLDSPPQVTCPEPGTLHLCAPDSISVPLAFSPDDANITITPPASYADGQLIFFADSDGDYCFEVIADNSCGADTCSFCITVTVDAPPQVTIADSSVYLCEAEEICVPYSYFDPDDNVVSVTVEPSRCEIIEGFVCFTPSGAGVYDIILTVADSCGNSDADTATVQVTLNQLPTVDVADTAVFLCEPADVCLPITFSDPDGEIDSVVAGAPAYYDADNQRICFPVTVSGQFEVPVTVYDTCGAAATASGIIIATVNSSPNVTVPNDTSMILCDTVEVCLSGFAFSDIDDNLDVIEFIPDIGLYGEGEYCFTPDTAGAYCFIARATDSCGAVAEDTVCVAIDWGENAIIDCPAGPVADTICDPDSICIPIPVQPFDAKVDILEPDGIYVNGGLCFYADSTGLYDFTVIATGECDADTCLVTVDVTLEESPAIICPTPDPVFLCEPDSVSVPLTITPATADVVISPPAVYENGELRFYADKEGDICFEVIASTVCGADTCEFCVTVSLNDPPTARIPDTAIALCDLQEVCIPVDYADPEGNIRSVVIEPDTYTMVDDSICFMPAGEGRYEIIITVTDSCDVQAVDTGIIDIYLNVGPTVEFGQFESPLYLCDLEQICVPITIDDPDDNIISVIGGNTCGDPVVYNAPDSLCWAPTSFGTCTLTVIVEDACGESDTAVAEIILIDAPYPNPPCIPNDTLVACGLGQVCIDLPAIEGEHYFRVKPDIYTVFPQMNTMCWIANENRTDTISIVDSTLCGVDSCSFVLTTLINRPPEITAEGPVDTAFCDSMTLCVEYTVNDPDGNIDTVLVSGTCPGAVVDIVNSRVCLDITEAIDCELRLVVRDECGLADTALVPIVAVPNRPPNINPPSIETVVRCETDTSAIVIADICVSDPDFDEVTLVLDSGLGTFSFNPLYDCGELTFTPPTNDTAEYCFRFRAADYCDTVYELFCVNVLPSAVCSTCVEVTIQGPPCVNSGGRAIVNITAETFNSIGGYDLLIGYDASALSFIRADLGLGISGWEYFTYRFGDLGNCEAPCPSGLLRLVAIADINNGPFHPPIEELTPNGSIASITFRVTSDLNFGGQRIPVRFFWTDCPDNGFSDPTGQYFYVDHIIFSPEGNIIWDELNDAVYPEANRPPHIGTPDECLVGDKYTPVRCVSYHNGEVCIQHPDSIDKRGDMNLNGVQYEIADAVVYTNYFIRGLDAFSISVAGQIAASDVNADGMTLSIGDLVYLIRVIVGDAPPYPKPLIESKVATASCTQRDGDAMVRIESTYDIGGVLMVFDGRNIESAIPILADDAAHMEMKYGWLAGNLRVLLYSMEPGGKIAAGVSDVVKLHLPDDGTVELTEIELADYFGCALTATVSNAALPDRLHLTQNRPNPFNPNTSFELALPKASEYSLTIYNITGQVIRRWTGYAEAGYVSFEWDGRDQNGGAVASGVYFYRAEALGQDTIRKMLLLK